MNLFQNSTILFAFETWGMPYQLLPSRILSKSLLWLLWAQKFLKRGFKKLYFIISYLYGALQLHKIGNCWCCCCKVEIFQVYFVESRRQQPFCPSSGNTLLCWKGVFPKESYIFMVILSHSINQLLSGECSLSLKYIGKSPLLFLLSLIQTSK